MPRPVPRRATTTELTASIGASPAKGPGLDRMTIVLVGDAGFNPTDAAVDAKGLHKGRAVTPFKDMTSGIAREIDGDLAFVNLETVVTDRNDLKPENKGSGKEAPFHFRSHPAGLKALIDVGFNLFSLANNHAMDYGDQGVEETLYHLAVANSERAIAYAGLGANLDEAIKPACLDLDGTRIGFDAIGIITGDLPQYRATANSPGQASYRQREDFEAVVNKLAALPADYRILSIHYGLEGRVVPDERQLDEWRGFAAGEKGIDLIVGHHPHVAQGVEIDGKSLIFYGLGNFLHPGTAEMTRFGHLPRLRADGQGASRPHRRELACRGDRGDPAHQHAREARALRREGRRDPHLRAQSSLRRSRRRGEGRQGRALHPAVGRLGALLRRRRRRSRRQDRHALPRLAARG